MEGRGAKEIVSRVCEVTIRRGSLFCRPTFKLYVIESRMVLAAGTQRSTPGPIYKL